MQYFHRVDATDPSILDLKRNRSRSVLAKSGSTLNVDRILAMSDAELRKVDLNIVCHGRT